MIKATSTSLELTRKISTNINNKTFHHHYHILYDIAMSYPIKYSVNYLEIGCYAGGSACLMLQRKNTIVYSIDLGHPISPDVVLKNVSNLNIHNNKYEYIKGDSKKSETYSKITDKIFDIIFIDGDHSYNGVISDFEIYSLLLKKGGYLVFDDYNDSQYSPQVKLAVDNIVKNIKGYNIIGCIKNTLGARPSDMIEGNTFILNKL